MRSFPQVVACAATALLVASCTVPPAGSLASPATPASSRPTAEPATGAVSDPVIPDPALAAFYQQTLTWTPCGQTECATFTVPLDYAHPAGRALVLAVERLPATESPRAGALVVNPGGPGYPGTDFVTSFPRGGLERFDIVGWDPRGTAATAPHCLDGPATDRLLDLDHSPDTPAETDALAAGSRALGVACAAADPDLLGHVSTQESARDLDILRAALGEERLSFYGASYGTLLGALHAELFPRRVGRLVLDAPSDLTGSGLSQALGFDRALAEYGRWCAGGQCSGAPGQTTPEAVVADLDRWLTSLDAAPLAVGDRNLTQSRAAFGVASYLYGGTPSWPALRDALAAARSGNGAELLAASDRFFGRRPDGTYTDALDAGQAIGCVDRPRLSPAQADADWARAREAAPVFGMFFGPDLGCSDWPAPPRPWLVPRAVDAPPILIVGGTLDPATPYEWAETAAATLASGRLLTYTGGGHVAYGRSGCVGDAVRRYLVSGELPPVGARC